MILADILVLALVWTKTWRIKRDGNVLRMRLPFTTLVLRDGASMFIIFLLTLLRKYWLRQVQYISREY